LRGLLPIIEGSGTGLPLWNYQKSQFYILARVIKIEKGKILFLIEFDRQGVAFADKQMKTRTGQAIFWRTTLVHIVRRVRCL
jgi:hypothetical protein